MKANSDYSDLISALSAAGAKFLIVGAYAVIHHTEPRYTKDLDIWVEPTRANARRVITALRNFGAPTSRLTEKDLHTPDIIYQIGVEPIRIDLLTSVAGLEFSEAYRRAVPGTFGGVTAMFLSLDDVLAAKRAAGRPQDLLDASRLEEARREKLATSVRLTGKPCKARSAVVATVSWSRSDNIESDAFIASLQKLPRRCDLVLCAGRAVMNHPLPHEMMAASRRSPVVFERDDGRWCVVHEERGVATRSVVRDKQEVFRRDQFDGGEHKGNNPVAAALARGEGIIHAEQLGVRFVLFICGENNALCYGSGASVLRDVPDELTVPSDLHQRWILLNPAHKPYPKGSRRGLTKVECVGKIGPMLGQLVGSEWVYRDATVPPIAVIHCNNFRTKAADSEKDACTRHNASVVFVKNRQHIPAREVGNDETRIVVYDVPLAQ